MNRTVASICIIVAFAPVFIGCRGDARRDGVAHPPTVRIGTFLKNGGALLADLLSREPLVAVGWDGRPLYRLAESAVESRDGETLSVTLRSNAQFHNGQPVTAERVRQLLLVKPDLMKEVAKIEVDGRTLDIHLKRANSLKLVDLSEHTIYDDKNLLLRTGPFKVTSSGTTAVLEPFTHYHQGAPLVARVEIREYSTHRAAWTAMMRGEVNFLHEVNRDAIAFIEAGGDIRAYRLLRPYYVPLVFNLKHPLLQRREVRLALNEAIDRDEIVRNGMGGHGEIADGPFWPHHWAYSQGRHPANYNPEAAKLRLDAAGLPVRRGNGQAMPSRFAFTCLLREGDARFERIALLVQRQLFAIGVDMQLRLAPQADFVSAIKSGAFEAFIFEIASGRSLSFPYQFWHSKATFLPTGYSAADEALERMKFASSDDEVRVAVSDVMRIMQSDPPAVFLVWPREARAADRSFELPYETDRDVLGNLWQLRWSPEMSARLR